jgi:hypothetical protein
MAQAEYVLQMRKAVATTFRWTANCNVVLAGITLPVCAGITTAPITVLAGITVLIEMDSFSNQGCAGCSGGSGGCSTQMECAGKMTTTVAPIDVVQIRGKDQFDNLATEDSFTVTITTMASGGTTLTAPNGATTIFDSTIGGCQSDTGTPTTPSITTCTTVTPGVARFENIFVKTACTN